MAADVPLAQVQGSVGQVHQDGAGVFQRGGDGKPHAARPGAQVQHAGVAGVFFQAADGQLGQHLRVHSGDEGGRIDEEPQAHEIPLADDVGDGFPCQTPVHVLLDGFSDGVGGVQGKIPVELHEKLKLEVEELGISIPKYLEMVIEEHMTRKGEKTNMADLRTVAVQVTEDLFSRLKAVLARNGMKQKDFLIGLIEDAIEKEEAKWKAESEEAEETEMEDPETAKSEPDEESVEPEAEEPETEALEAETDGEMTEPDEAEADEEPTEPENEEPAEAEPTELETKEAEESEPEEAESEE